MGGPEPCCSDGKEGKAAMKTMRWGDGSRWGNPNARWGSPSYILEPGDPGYVIPAPPIDAISKTKTKHNTMSSNATPSNRLVLLPLAHNIYSGQLANEVSVGLVRHVATRMDVAILKIEGDPGAAAGSAANKGSQLVCRECVDAAGAAEFALKELSDGTVKDWLDGYRKIMEGIHGKKANDGWVSAGLPADSTAVPRNHDERHTLLAAARAYLAAHPTYEAALPQATGPALAITAAQALVLHTAMQAANTLINSTSAVQVVTKTARDGDVTGLFKEVSGTIGEIGESLADDDARWEVFGLNIPANPNAPLGVSGLTVTTAGPGRELVAWPYAVRAEYYRLFLKRVGVDAEAINVADPKDLETVLKALTAGSTIEVYVVPMNAGGAGPASPTVTKVVGA